MIDGFTNVWTSRMRVALLTVVLVCVCVCVYITILIEHLLAEKSAEGVQK